jgi:hypothetical protein
MTQKIALVLEGTTVYQHKKGKKPVAVYTAEDIVEAIDKAEQMFGHDNYYILE